MVKIYNNYFTKNGNRNKNKNKDNITNWFPIYRPYRIVKIYTNKYKNNRFIPILPTIDETSILDTDRIMVPYLPTTNEIFLSELPF